MHKLVESLAAGVHTVSKAKWGSTTSTQVVVNIIRNKGYKFKFSWYIKIHMAKERSTGCIHTKKRKKKKPRNNVFASAVYTPQCDDPYFIPTVKCLLISTAHARYMYIVKFCKKFYFYLRRMFFSLKKHNLTSVYQDNVDDSKTLKCSNS